MKAVGILTIALAIAIAVVPIFTECLRDGKMVTTADGRSIPMKCHWTAMASLALALPLAVIGAEQAVSRRREARLDLATLGVVLGALVIALPTALIGVCTHPDALCNLVMKPTLILAGSLVLATSLFGLITSFRRAEPAGFAP